MTEQSYPFPPVIPGDLTDPGVIGTADKWRRQARWWARSGVHIEPVQAGSLAVVPATDALAVDLGPGKATVEGFYYENTSNIRFQVSPAHPTLNRWDRVVARLVLDPVTGLGRVRAFYVAGNPGDALARPLTQTDTTWEVNLGRFLVAAGAGRAAANVATPFARSSVGEPSQQFVNALPDPQDAGRPWALGETCFLSNGDGQNVEYVWSPGDGGWCVKPGQMLFYAAFTDSQAQPYNTGFFRVGQRGGADSLYTFRRPPVLTGRGLRVSWWTHPLVVGPRKGDPIATTIYNNGAGVDGPAGMAVRTIQNADSTDPSENATHHGSYVFNRDDLSFGVTGQVTEFCIAATASAAGVQFTEGRVLIESI